MDGSHIFRSGKYKGKTIDEVMKVNPQYIDWIATNQPTMLVPKNTTNNGFSVVDIGKKKQEFIPKLEPLETNYDFLDQGPHGKLTSNKIEPNE